MVTIIYKSSHTDFCEIPLGEFFMVGSALYFKYSATHAFQFAQNGKHEFEAWSEVQPVDVEIKVK